MVIPVRVRVPASPRVGEMLDFAQHPGPGQQDHVPHLTVPWWCRAEHGRVYTIICLTHLFVPSIFVSKIKLLCSTRAKQSRVSRATILGGGLRSVLRSLGSVGAVAAAPGQGWCWTGPANTACPGPPAPLVPAVTCRAAEGPPAPAFRASLLRAERRERPRSQHEHPQGLQHLGHRLPGDQIPTERSDQNPRWEKHQVRAGGHLPGQRSAGGDEGEGRQPQSHPAPDRQRRPLLRGLRALCGSGGTKHPAGIPEAGLSPGLPSRPGLYLHS